MKNVFGKFVEERVGSGGKEEKGLDALLFIRMKEIMSLRRPEWWLEGDEFLVLMI